jgi:SAM-dependent methyltransferase
MNTVNFKQVQEEQHSIFIAFNERARNLNERVINKQERASKKGQMFARRFYVCIHLYPHDFVNCFNQLAPHLPSDKPLKFLDVGCGIGHKMFMAKSLYGFDVHGLDLRKPYLDTAHTLLMEHFGKNHGLPKKSEDYLFHTNAFNFKKFAEFDVIYFYCPISDCKLQRKLECHLLERAKIGCVIAGFLPQWMGSQIDNGIPGWERIKTDGHGLCYRKVGVCKIPSSDLKY